MSDVSDKRCENCTRLETRQQELLVTIRNLSATVPYPDEDKNAAILIAKVGTLRAQLDELVRTVLDRSHFEAIQLAKSIKGEG